MPRTHMTHTFVAVGLQPPESSMLYVAFKRQVREVLPCEMRGFRLVLFYMLRSERVSIRLVSCGGIACRETCRLKCLVGNLVPSMVLREEDMQI